MPALTFEAEQYVVVGSMGSGMLRQVLQLQPMMTGDTTWSMLLDTADGVRHLPAEAGRHPSGHVRPASSGEECAIFFSSDRVHDRERLFADAPKASFGPTLAGGISKERDCRTRCPLGSSAPAHAEQPAELPQLGGVPQLHDSGLPGPYWYRYQYAL